MSAILIFGLGYTASRLAELQPDAAVLALIAQHEAICMAEKLGCGEGASPWFGLLLPSTIALALALFFVLGVGRRLRDLLTARAPHRLRSALFAFVLTIWVAICTLPARHYLEQILDFSAGARVFIKIKTPSGGWKTLGGPPSLAEWLEDKGWEAIGFALLAALVAPLVYRLIRAQPRHFWIVPAALAGASIGVMTLSTDRFYEVVPMPAATTAARELRALMDRHEIPQERLVMGLTPLLKSPLGAAVEWREGSSKIVMGQGLIGQYPSWFPANGRVVISKNEVLAIAGHELAHYQKAHLWQLLAFRIVFAAFLFWAAWRLSGVILSRSFDRFGVAEQEDIAAMPLHGCLWTIGYLFFALSINAFILFQEYEADRLGLELARQPDGMISFVMRDERNRSIRRPAIEQWLFYTHPDGEDRLAVALKWKADKMRAAR